MKTCTQISDSGFRWKINVVSPGRRAGFSHVNREVKSRAGPLPYKLYFDPVKCVNCSTFKTGLKEMSPLNTERFLTQRNLDSSTGDMSS